jgi:DNA-binding transcriptional LysR family regulator
VALALVAAGVGIALVPTSACYDLTGIVALPLQRSPSRVLHAVTRTPKDHLPLLPAMLQALKSTAREGVQARWLQGMA